MVFGWLTGLATRALGAVAPALIESGKNALMYGAMKLGGAGLKWLAPKIQSTVGSGFRWLARKTGLVSPDIAGALGEGLVQSGTSALEGRMEELSKRKREEAISGATQYVQSQLDKSLALRGNRPSSENQAEKILREGENTLKQKKPRLAIEEVD